MDARLTSGVTTMPYHPLPGLLILFGSMEMRLADQFTVVLL